jgi:hypothetical protein
VNAVVKVKESLADELSTVLEVIHGDITKELLGMSLVSLVEDNVAELVCSATGNSLLVLCVVTAIAIAVEVETKSDGNSLA